MICSTHEAASAQAERVQPKNKDIVVIGRRPKSPVDDIKPDDTVSDTAIKSLGLDSIGEVIERLRQRYGADFSVIVNGRLVGSLDAVTSLPPEALAKIDILPPLAAGRFGLRGGQRVLNLQLRPKFHTITGDGRISGTTEGGGDSEAATSRYADINGDRRMNAAVTYQRSSPLRASERGVNDSEDPLLIPSSTLVPKSQSLATTIGLAGPLGASNYDLSLSGDASDQRASDVALLAFGAPSGRSLTRTTSQRSLRATMTINGTLGRQFWSFTAGTGLNWLRASSGATVDGTGSIWQLSVNQSLRAGLTGGIFKLPAGEAILSSSLQFTANNLRSTLYGGTEQRSVRQSNGIISTEDLRLPLTKRTSRMGELSFNVGTQTTHQTPFGNAFSYHYGAEWRPDPTALVEAILPGRFVRSSDGTLLSYDSRPIIGVRESQRRLSWNLNINGTLIPTRQDRSDPSRLRDGISWFASINHDFTLSDDIEISGNQPVVNTLLSPLSISSSAPARHRVTFQGSINGRTFGANFNASWKSGSREGGLSTGSFAASSVIPLWLLGADAYYNISQNTVDPGNPESFTVRLAITNILNARPVVEGANRKTYGLISDPLGRTITLSLRKAF
ncbi:unnamed protein product [Cylicocyclus nassatus]|uniref:TonB-dependent receptor n=1 Tax=Cylicocyclus nassatus TaxID=53992 RepID=A0AA36GYQ3_CYLNA|nr:unnamed protein product [Cylicocyclus nassatus]